MSIRHLTFLVLAALATFLPGESSAQAGKTFTGASYAITFNSRWDTTKVKGVIGHTGGLGGIAALGATPGNSLPNVDSIMATFKDSLGGDLKKDSSGQMTIAGYEVHWQKFTYDTLPKLSAAITAAMGFPVTLKNGSFRVYYLNANGVGFSIAGMAVIPRGTPPYADVEAALATLKLGPQSGIVPLGGARLRDLWVRDGKLGGAWLRANRVFAVECYDSRGAMLGYATHAAEGAWKLPVGRGEMLVRLRTAQGTGLHFMVRQ